MFYDENWARELASIINSVDTSKIAEGEIMRLSGDGAPVVGDIGVDRDRKIYIWGGVDWIPRG